MFENVATPFVISAAPLAVPAAPAARRIVCALRLRSARALLAEFQRLDIGKRLGFRDANQATLQDYRSVVKACSESDYSSHLVDELDGVVLEL